MRRPGTAAFLRELNHRAVFEELDRRPQSRSQLAASTGLSKPTVSAALAHLTRAGLVRPGGFCAGPAGPAAELFARDPSAGFVVGVQLTGRVEAAVADLDGRILSRLRAPYRARAAGSFARAVAAVAQECAADAGLALGAASAVVVAVPGVPHPPSGTVRRATTPAVSRPGFLAELSDVLGPDCLVANDVNLAAVGEHRWGAAAGRSDFALVSLRPGLGLAAFVDGRLRPGVHGAAGEVALLPVMTEHDLDRLVARAARRPGEELLLVEAASSSGLVRLANRLGLSTARTARHVYRSAREGDRTAVRAVRAHTRQLALVVAAAAAVLDPEMIVVSGYLDEPVAAHLREVLRTLDADGPDVVPGHLGEEAVLLGALAAGLPAAHERVFARSQDPLPEAQRSRQASGDSVTAASAMR